MAIFQDITSKFTSGINFSGILGGFTIFIYMMIGAAVIGIILWIILSNLRYVYKIQNFENISGQGFVPTSKDRAMLIKVGDGGEELLYLKKSKVYRTAYGRKISKNTYAFAKSSAGYWHNITFGNLDSKLKEIGVDPVDRDMRYMHVAIRRNIKDRFNKTTFLEKYGGLIAYVALIAVTGIMMYLLFDKYIKISSSVNGAIDSARQVLEATKQILAANNNILSSGGIQSA